MSSITGKVIAITGKSVATRITDAGGEVIYTTADVRQRDALQALVAMAVAEYGRLDVLISNAGVMPISPLADLRIDDWDLMVDVNIKGILHGIAAALPVFTGQQSGHFSHD